MLMRAIIGAIVAIVFWIAFGFCLQGDKETAAPRAVAGGCMFLFVVIISAFSSLAFVNYGQELGVARVGQISNIKDNLVYTLVGQVPIEFEKKTILIVRDSGGKEYFAIWSSEPLPPGIREFKKGIKEQDQNFKVKVEALVPLHEMTTSAPAQ